jgi:hypothetical protein
MLQLLTNIHDFQCSSFKLQNSIYIFDWNIVAFQTCRVLLWPVKDVTSCGKYVQGIKSYISCVRYMTQPLTEMSTRNVSWG